MLASKLQYRMYNAHMVLEIQSTLSCRESHIFTVLFFHILITVHGSDAFNFALFSLRIKSGLCFCDIYLLCLLLINTKNFMTHRFSLVYLETIALPQMHLQMHPSMRKHLLCCLDDSPHSSALHAMV